MAYVGSQVAIPLGALGLKTDDAATHLPPNAAIKANNVSFYTGNVSKSASSTPYNLSHALASAIVGLWDYFPTPTQQRLIAVTSDGNIYRDTGDATFSSTTPLTISGLFTSTLGTCTSDTLLCEGGAESAGVNKKLFIFSGGSSQVVTLDGDATVANAIQFPALDWASSYPSGGIVHNGRLFAFGNSNSRHTLYASKLTNNFTNQACSITLANPAAINCPAHGLSVNARIWFTTTGGLPLPIVTRTAFYVKTVVDANTINISLTVGGAAISTLTSSQSGTHTLHTGSFGHEDFATSAIGDTALTFSVYPGESDGLVGACEYQSRLFLFKRPFGVYYLDDSTDPSDFTTWSIKKLGSTWGIASPHGAIQVLTDLIGANTTGSYTSLQATNALGDVVAGDILSINKLENYIRGQFDRGGIPSTQAIYYAEKKIAYFTARQQGSSQQDRMLAIDLSNQTPRFSIETKDKPNCLALRKDAHNIPRPIYGGTDGLVYQMDQSAYNVNSAPYLGEFQTAYTDFGFVDSSLAAKNKIFDFIEIDYVPQGSWSFYIDISVDGRFRETINVQQRQSGAVLGTFVLDRDALADDPTARPLRKPLHCTGKTISFRIYNNGLDQNFKVDRLLVSFRLSGEQQGA